MLCVLYVFYASLKNLNCGATPPFWMVSFPLEAIPKRCAIKQSLPDMDSISLQLLVQASLAAAIPVLDNGMGKGIGVTEEKISDFAILTGENLDNLPPDFTICSSVASASFLSTFSPFQLLYPDHKKPWISIYFYGPQKGSTLHRMMFFVSFFLLKVPNRTQHISGG